MNSPALDARGPALRPPTLEARAFADAVLARILVVGRELTLVEIVSVMDATHGFSGYLIPSEGDALNAALAELPDRPVVTARVAELVRAAGELVFRHFPNPFTVCCD